MDVSCDISVQIDVLCGYLAIFRKFRYQSLTTYKSPLTVRNWNCEDVSGVGFGHKVLRADRESGDRYACAMAELDLCFSFTVKAKIAELAAQGRVFRIPELNGKFKFLIRSGIAARGNDRFADDQAAARDAVCDGGIQISVTVADRLFASLQRVAFVRTPKVSIGILPEQEILQISKLTKENRKL